MLRDRRLLARRAACRRFAADQIVGWPAVHAYGYGNFTTILEELAEAVTVSRPTVGR